jgi:phage shock protein A
VAQTILGRIGQLVQANINAILDQAEDPEKMLDQLVRDYTKSISDAEEAVAQTVGSLRLAEDDQREALEASKEWGQKAIAASRKADEVRRTGSGGDGGRFDELAKVALRRQLSYEEQARTQDSQITQQRELTEKLKQGLNKLRAKREELVHKRNELVSRAKMARAQTQVQRAVKSVSVMDPTTELNRFEDRVRREEALARGREEVAISSLEEQFEQLESGEDEAEVEARFAQLKSGQPVGQLTRGS